MKNKEIKIIGKAKKISNRQVRAIVQATLTICSFHNKCELSSERILIRFVDNEECLGKNEITGGACWGRAWWGLSYTEIYGGISKRHVITTLIHELLHLCIRHKGGQEMPTSTLTARLKPLIIEMANTLIVGPRGKRAGTQQRAAWFAHTSIKYKRSRKEDSYNSEQWKASKKLYDSCDAKRLAKKAA